MDGPKAELGLFSIFDFCPKMPFFWIGFMKSPINCQNGSQDKLSMLETFKPYDLITINQTNSRKSVKMAHILVP